MVPTSPARLVELEQGSAEWLEWRAARYTASNAPAVMCANPWVPKTPRQLFLVRSGQLKVFVNAAMRAGNEDEGRARELVKLAYGGNPLPACFESEAGDLPLGASLDAVDVLAHHGEAVAWELKRPAKGSASDLWSASEAPAHYLWQMAHQLLTVPQLGRVHLVAYAADLDAIRTVDTLERDSDRYATMAGELLAAWALYHEAEANLREPGATEADVVEVDAEDVEFSDAVAELRAATDSMKWWEGEVELKRARVLELAKVRGAGAKVTGCGATVFPTERAGNVNWKAKPIVEALKAAGVNPEEYRGKPSVSWTVKLAGKEGSTNE